MQRICTTASLVDAYLIQGLLESEGVEATVRGVGIAPALGASVLPEEQVRDAARALRHALRDYV